jgi:chorismate synthase
MLRMLTAGESHGKALVAVLEGLPAGVPVDPDALAHQLARRRHGHGRGGRQRFETDRFEILGGVRHGRTLGSPIAVTIPNLEFEAKYSELMGVTGEMDPADRLTRPRPGHADLAGAQKYGFDDVRNVLERASARETAARVAAGTFCRWFLTELGIDIVSHVVRIGSVKVRARSPVPGPGDAAMPRSRRRWSPRSTVSGRLATPWEASSRCWPTAPRRASDRTCTTIASSTRASRWRS